MKTSDIASSIQKDLLSRLKLRKTAARMIAEGTSAIIHSKSANTNLIANSLPVGTVRDDMRQQKVARILSADSYSEALVWAPFARERLAAAAKGGQRIVLAMDQTEIGHRHAILMISMRYENRAIPLAWRVEEGEANIGAAKQVELVNLVDSWLPPGASPILMGDRFYPSGELFVALAGLGWGWRIRMKATASLVCSFAHADCVGDLDAMAEGSYYGDSNAAIFNTQLPMSIGWLREKGHADSWCIAMDCPASEAATRDYGLRWGIETMFSDFKSRGFNLQKSQMEKSERLSKLLLLVALAMDWCLSQGQALASAQKKAA